MDDERRRQQYGTPYHQTGAGRAAQSMGPPSSERYTQPSSAAPRSEMTRAVANRSYVPGYGGYSYPESQYAAQPALSSSPMQGVELQYPSGYTTETARPPQLQTQQQYNTYGQNVILPPGPSQSVYETVPQYQQRQAAAVLSSQFGVPQYLPQAENAPVAMPVPQAHYMASQPEQVTYGQPLSASRTAPQSYVAQPSHYPASEQQQQEQEAEEAAAHQQSLNETLRQCREQIKAIFGLLRVGRVSDASQKTMELSRWLLSSVAVLDLHHDKQDEQQSRLDLWREFNLCWETLGQKQKDIIEEAVRTQQQPADILSTATMTGMIDELIKLCDEIEQHGLVDFEMGVWEEQIVNIFMQCLDLLNAAQGQGQSTTSQTGPPTAP